jgi:signal transduction histidine kinase
MSFDSKNNGLLDSTPGDADVPPIPPDVLARRFDARVRTGLLIATAIVIPALAARLITVLREPADENWGLSIFVLMTEMALAVALAVGFYFRRLPLDIVQPSAAILSLYMIFGACLVIVQTQLHWPAVAVVIVLVGAGNVLLSWRWFGVVALGGVLGLVASVASIQALTMAQSLEVVGWTVLFLGIAMAAHLGRINVYRRIESLRWRDEQIHRELVELVERLRREVRERRAAEARVREQERRLRQLAHRLLTIQETERARISRELHDELGQILSAINMQILACRGMAGTDELVDRLDECSDMVREAIDQVRQLATELRPSVLDDFGLDTALRWIVERQAARANLRISYESRDGGRRFPLDVEAACFRIVQEAVTNAVRHSGGTRVRVFHVNDGGRLTVRVEDDGRGFDPKEPAHRPIHKLSLGLVGMRERAESLGGRIAIRSAMGRGTVVEVEFLRESSVPTSAGALET